MLIAITGESGAGKSTLLTLLARDYKMGILPSYTTRASRNLPTDSNYRFMNDAAYKAMEDGDEFALDTTFCGFKYGTKRSDVEAAIASSNTVAATLTVNSVAHLRRQNFSVWAAFLHIDQHEACKRMKSRGDEAWQLESRINSHTREMEAVLSELARGQQFLIVDGFRSTHDAATDLIAQTGQVNC